MRTSIFAKMSGLKPTTMRTVAERRYGDAVALRDTKSNARANGVAYMSGFVIEILLKAWLVDKYSSIAKKPRGSLSDDEKEKWFLIWKSHDLEDMLAYVPELEAALQKKGEIEGYAYLEDLKEICATWTIQARYSPHSMTMQEASVLLDKVRTLKELLK